jgi:RNA polymerase sigma factor (sigma-70 family)
MTPAAASAADQERTFERLYERYVRDVYRYTLAVLRNPDDAEDVTQTTFMNAYRAMQAGTSPEKPQHWLIKIAHNACRTRYVHATRRPSEVPLDDQQVAELPVDDDAREELAEVLHALGELPFTQRSALVMRELEGCTYEEIAENLGVSVPSVESLIFRARRSLRLKRSALRAISAVQLPASLAQFFENGSAVATGGAAAVGSGLLVKAVAVVVAGAVVGGAGYTAAGDRPQPRQHASALAAAANASWGSARLGFLQALTTSAVLAAGAEAKAHASGKGAATKRDGAQPEARSAPDGGAAIAVGKTESSRPASEGARATSAPPAAPGPDATTTVARTVPASLPELPAVPPVTTPPASPVPAPTVTVPALPPVPTVPAVPAVPTVPAPPGLP